MCVCVRRFSQPIIILISLSLSLSTVCFGSSSVCVERKKKEKKYHRDSIDNPTPFLKSQDGENKNFKKSDNDDASGTKSRKFKFRMLSMHFIILIITMMMMSTTHAVVKKSVRQFIFFF